MQSSTHWPQENPPTVYVVDDDPGMRKSLQLVLSAAGLTARIFESAESFLDAYDDRSPGCLVLDMYMPQMNGADLIRALRQRGHTIPVLVVTGTASVRLAVQTMKLGAIDFLEKPLPHTTLLDRVRQALSADCRQHATELQKTALEVRLQSLSDRERELLDLLVAGHSNKQAAMRLHISIKTVENHRARLMKKMGATNTADLVRMRLQAA